MSPERRPEERMTRTDGIGLVAVLGLSAAVSWLSSAYPAKLPVWAPWDFSWVEFPTLAMTLWWYGHGLARTRPESRPPRWRQAFFLAGMAGLYAVLQTRFEYMTQHMFFLNRIQHIVMHHLGPFLIALGWPGETIDRGMPAPFRRLIRSRPVRAVMDVLQQPAIAAFLFVGLVYFWLIPAIQFRAMIDPHLYALMNWSMVVDGLLFWFLVLDPRPKPPARTSFVVRALAAFSVMLPQILLGAYISFVSDDLYPVYALCGRIFPSITPLQDQTLGGLIIWIPSTMMSAIAFLLVLNFYRIYEKSLVKEDARATSLAAYASRWTG